MSSKCSRCGLILHNSLDRCPRCGNRLTVETEKMIPPDSKRMSFPLKYGNTPSKKTTGTLSKIRRQKILLGVLVGTIIILQIVIMRELANRYTISANSENVENEQNLTEVDSGGVNNEYFNEESPEEDLPVSAAEEFEVLDVQQEDNQQEEIQQEKIQQEDTLEAVAEQAQDIEETAQNSENSEDTGNVVITWTDANLMKAVRRSAGFKTDITVKDAQSVKKLDLTGAGVQDIDDLRYFTGLQELKLGKNYIYDISPISTMEHLQILNLEDNVVYDLEPLRNIRYLRRLDLYKNIIDDVSPLAGLTDLTMLDIRENDVEDISAFQEMNYLEELYLSNNRIRDLGPVSNMSHLVYLGVKNNPVEDITPAAYHEKLNALILSGTNVEDIDIAETLPKLTYLDIRNCPITNFSVIRRLEKKGVKIDQ